MNKYYAEDYNYVLEETDPTEIISGAGGGCFPSGTLVRTAHGYRAIDTCQVNELILSYDRFGEVDFGMITEVIVHPEGTYEDDLYFIFCGETSVFPKGITGNHAVYHEPTKEHKQIKDFAVGEQVMSYDGTLLTITKITLIPNEEIKAPVFNLIVHPQHTYLVGTSDLCIRVHNGGGGKSSGTAARAAQEAPNTLQSSSIASVLEVISHGEIAGIVGGAKGVTFNNTALQSASGEFNFDNVTFTERKGTFTQSPIPGFDYVQAVVVGAQTGVVHTNINNDLVNTNTHGAFIILQLDEGLWAQNINNGDLNGYTIQYQIWVAQTGGSYSLVIDNTINAKATSPEQITHRVTKPSGATFWSIKVVRVSPEDATVATKSIISLVSITEITEQLLSYDKIAYVGLKVPAKSVSNQIPARAYDVMGILCQVPNNFNPLTRKYTGGFWNGGFVSAWTDDTAWILYDLITNVEYGMNSFMNQPVDVDIWAFHEASMYNNCVGWNGSTYSQALIPDGYGLGGTEVRYTFNAVIATQSDAWQLLFAVASNMRALPVMKGNQISLIQDRPRVPRRIFNNSNVINGTFLYAGTEATSRATSINCTFNEASNRYLPKTLSEEDSVGIARYGLTVKDIVAYGCTRESQARRMAKWALYTELEQSDLCSFSIALNIVDLAPGEVISTMDDDEVNETNEFLTGRIVSIIGTTVTLGNSVTLKAGHVYTFGVMSSDYSQILESAITDSAGITNTLHLVSTLPAEDYTDNEFFCFSSGSDDLKHYSIQSITESGKGIYSISGIAYTEAKYAYIEQGISLPIVTPSNIFSTVLPAVTNIRFAEVFMNDGITAHNYIQVNWDWNLDGAIKDQVSYVLRWRRDNNNYQIAQNIVTKDYHIPDTTPGHYDVIIEVINIQGKKSLQTLGTYAYRVTANTSTLLPPTNFYVAGTTGTAFTGTHIPLTWTFPSANATMTDTLLDYILEVWSVDGSIKLNQYVVRPNAAKFLSDGTTANPGWKGGSFDYLLQNNLTDYGIASRSVQFKLYSRDMVGDISTASIKTFTNAVPSHTNFTFTLVNGIGTEYLHINQVTPETDIAGYIVARNTTGTTTGATLLDVGFNLFPAFAADTSLYYAVAAYDSFGKTGLDYSSFVLGAPLSFNVDRFTFGNLHFTPNSPGANQITWTTFTVSKNGSGSLTTVLTGNLTWTTGQLYIGYSDLLGAIVSTTDLSVAITYTQILATYRGGIDLASGDGSAFIDGGQIVARSLAANALIANSLTANEIATGSAVITGEAQIATAIINNGHIKDVIQSASYNAGTKQGWQINKAGNITSYGTLTMATAGTGTARTENTGDVIRVYDSSGVLRVKLGNLA
jgi:predicted phage tail protein